jgi:hypothetical protein
MKTRRIHFEVFMQGEKWNLLVRREWWRGKEILFWAFLFLLGFL